MDNSNFVMAYSVDKEFVDDRFLKLRLRVCHDEISPNKTWFDKTTMERANATLEYIPILAHVFYDEEGKPVLGGHDMHIEQDKFNKEETRMVYDETPVGIVPSLEVNNCEISEYDGKNYTYVDAFIWKDYCNYCEDIIENSGNIKISMEIDMKDEDISFDAKRECYVIADYRYRGITLLNEKYGTGMKNAMATTTNFSLADDVKEKMVVLMQQLQDCLRDYNNAEEKGDEKVVLEELLEEFGLSAEELDFETDGLSDEELREKLEDFACKKKKKMEEESEDETEEETITETDACKKRKKCSIDEHGDMEIVFEVSHEEIHNALYALLAEFENSDNDWYFITDVYDDKFIYQNWGGNKYYSQGYAVDGDNVSFVGERVEVFKMMLTESEKIAIEKLRGDYSELQEKYSELLKFKTDVEEAEVEVKKNEVFSKKSYEKLSDNADFIELKKNMKNFSLDEIVTKAKVIYADYMENNEYAKQKDAHVVSVKFEAADENHSIYGGLFDDFKKNNK